MESENTRPKGEFAQIEFDRMIREHEAWLENNNAGKKMVLLGNDLGGLRIHGNLSKGEFENCQLDYATFDGVNLTSAIFTNSNLRGIKASDIVLDGTSFDSCDFEQSELNGLKADNRLTLENCNLRKTIIQNCIFVDANFNQVSFNDSILKNVKFYGSSSITGKFLRTSIFTSLIENCQLVLFNFTDVTLAQVNFDNSNFNFVAPATNVDFRDKVSLKGVSLNGQVIKCKFSGIDFTKDVNTGAVFNIVTFTDCDLENVNLSKSSLISTKFLNSRLNRAIISASTFKEGELTNCIASELKASSLRAYKTDFSNSELVNSEFLNSHLSRAKFVNSKLDGATLTFADLSGSDQTNATIQSTSFGGANLNGATYVDGGTCRAGSIGFCKKLPQ